MQHYSRELKESIVRRMLPPESVSVSQLVQETGISDATLYTWRKEALGTRNEASEGGSFGRRSSADKLLAVVETYSMNEEELSEYCRRKGLYKEEVMSWRDSCLNANEVSSASAKDLAAALRGEKKKVRDLERELKRKDKALAEAAALLVLRKKVQAIWGESEDE
jgi:transposase-like protein